MRKNQAIFIAAVLVLSSHALALEYHEKGYQYLSPIPEAEYVSPQTRFVLVRFETISPYNIIFDNNGNPIWYLRTSDRRRDFKVQDNGWLTMLIRGGYGGEQWQRGLEYFILWDDNLSEDVVIELYKGDSLLQTIKTTPSTGAYAWEVGLGLGLGSD